MVWMSLRKKWDVWAEVEKGLGSSGRIKILRYLIEHPTRQFTRYSLRRSTGLSTEELTRHLQVLVELGWIRQFPHEPKTYQINMENRVVKVIIKFFWDLRKLRSI